MSIIRCVLPTPLRQLFDYYPPADCDVTALQPGMRVRLPFGRRELVGMIWQRVDNSDVANEKLKLAIEVIDSEPLLDEAMLRLAQFAAEYYHHALGEVVVGTLPQALRQGKALIKKEHVAKNMSQTVGLSLTTEQASAVDKIRAASGFNVFLLAGVTGSGKTEVYMQIMADHLSRGEQVLMLVPEIGLTPQACERLLQRFAVPVVMLHSNMTAKQKLIAWSQAYYADAKIILGTRSALFAPLPRLGLIVVDEEHDESYKQTSGFRYCARDLAVQRAKLSGVPIILGSATPALQSLANVRRGRYQYLTLSQRVGAKLPTVSLIDLRGQQLHAGISNPLFARLDSHLAAGNQVLLFLNQRGFAPVLLCHLCGWVAECKRCDVRLTLHHKANRLVCHHCESRQPVMQVCPACKQTELLPVGYGTEQLMQVLMQRYPNYPCVRVDRDTTTKKHSLAQMIADIENNSAKILVGTQMLAKGHHFPNLTLVAIIDVDGGLLSADYRAIERMAQTIVQVAGRAGRADKAGEVILQTHYPQHPLLQLLLSQGYQAFAQSLLDEREQLQLPPYGYQALLRAEALDAQSSINFLQAIKKQIPHTQAVHLFGPMPTAIPRKAGRYRQELIFVAPERKFLHHTIEQALHIIPQCEYRNKIRWAIDVDPID